VRQSNVWHPGSAPRSPRLPTFPKPCNDIGVICGSRMSPAAAAGDRRDEPCHARNDSTGQISMKDHYPTDPRLAPALATAQDDASKDTPQAAPDPADGAQIFRTGHQSEDDLSDVDDTARLPGITSLPEGIEVVETEIGRAVGQWILMVRCQCGKRWFEIEAVEAATCPRCSALVYVDMLQDRPD